MNQDMDGLFGFPAEFGEDVSHDTQLFESSYASPHFTTINGPSASQSSTGTVSPKDLLRDPLASAPPSAAFTNLTSPSIFDSPDVAESFETSPMFNNADADLGVGPEAWFSLFPGATGESDDSPANPTEDFLDSALANTGISDGNWRTSSPGHSPPVARGTHKHSSISGVSSRKRDKPLPPITVEDPSDTVAVKRARNTEAARKSRQKKVQKFEQLEKQIEELQAQVEHWKSLALNGNSA